jgi:hypothetical protein
VEVAELDLVETKLKGNRICEVCYRHESIWVSLELLIHQHEEAEQTQAETRDHRAIVQNLIGLNEVIANGMKSAVVACFTKLSLFANMEF